MSAEKPLFAIECGNSHCGALFMCTLLECDLEDTRVLYCPFCGHKEGCYPVELRAERKH